MYRYRTDQRIQIRLTMSRIRIPEHCLLQYSLADPGSGAFLTHANPGSGTGKIQDTDQGSESGMNSPDHECLETIFLGKNNFFDADPGWKKLGSGMEHCHN